MHTWLTCFHLCLAFIFFLCFLLSVFYQSFQSDHPKDIYQHLFSLASYLFSLPAFWKDLSSFATISFMFWVISIPPPISCFPFLIWFKEVPPFSFISLLAFVLYRLFSPFYCSSNVSLLLSVSIYSLLNVSLQSVTVPPHSSLSRALLSFSNFNHNTAHFQLTLSSVLILPPFTASLSPAAIQSVQLSVR